MIYLKSKRFLAGVLLLAMLTVSLSGCGASLKVARVAAKFGTALKEQPITSATAEISLGITSKTQGIPASSRFRSVVRSQVNWEDGRSYSDIEAATNFTGEPLSDSLQCYSAGGENETVRYVHADSTDLWLRVEDQLGVMSLDPALILMLLDSVSQDTTIEEKENPAGGSSHYLLKLNFEPAEIQKLLEKTGLPIPEEILNLDLQNVKMPVELELEEKTYLPLRLKMEIKGIDQKVIESAADLIGKKHSVQGLDLEVEEISLLITNFGYEPQDIPMLPKGAAENALDAGKLKQMKK